MAAEGNPSQAAPGQSPRRLFFALWPDDAMREALAQSTREAARASGGRPVPASNLHVTLAFLGSVPQRRLAELGDIARGAAEAASGGAAGAPASPLILSFDRLEHWRAAQVLCALATAPEPWATMLFRRLQERLIGGGFAPDLKPFRPHVTVARKVVSPGATGAIEPVVWRFTEVALIESRTLPEGALYSVVDSFPLCGNRKAANNSETP